MSLPLVSKGQFTNKGNLFIDSNTDISTLEIFNNTIDGNLINDGNLFLYDNYNNEGLVSFSFDKITSTTWLVGNKNDQAINATLPIDCYNLIFDKSTSNILPIGLTGELTIFGNADFKQGILDTNTYLGKLRFEKGSTTSNASDGSFVDGKVFKFGNEAFDFPIGNKNFYRKASISAPANNNDSFSLIYYYAAPRNLSAIPTNIEAINNQEYWEIKKENASSDIILTLSWDDTTTTPANLVVDPSKLHIMRWDEATNTWRDEAGVVDETNRTITTPINISKYGIFTLATERFNPSVTSGLITIINNGISPNGDGLNDYFKISGIEDTQNTVSIFNRWGSKVYETTNYGTDGNVFAGIAQNNGLLGSNEILPTGTYFYVITYTENGTGNTGKKVGYLYIN